MIKLKELKWVASAKKDLNNFPEAVKDEVGYSLYRVQEGKMPRLAKPMRGAQ